jgi:hypothetical protein
MRNILYTSMMALIILNLLVWGGHHLYHNEHVVRGAILFLLGIVMCGGFRTLNPSPSRVWLLSFFGQKTTVLVRRFTYLIPWIVTRVEFVLEKRDVDFKLKKAVRCHDGTYIPQDKGFISASVWPDDKDDSPGTPNPRSAGQKLRDLDDAGGVIGSIQHTEDLVTTYTEKIANEPGRSAQWMETHGLEIARDLLPRIQGLPIPTSHNLIISAAQVVDDNEQDDTRGLGIRFTRFVPVYQQPEVVIKESNDHQVELMQRIAELDDTETVNRQVQKRFEAWIKHHGPGVKVPDFNFFRNQIVEERLMKDGKYQRVDNPGGMTLVNATPPRPGGQGNPPAPGGTP